MAEGTERHGFGELFARARQARGAGEGDEAFSLFEAAFERLGREGTSVEAAELLREIAYLHQERGGDLELAEEMLGASLAVAEACSLHCHVAHALNGFGILAYMHGEIDVAEALYLRARAIAERERDERLLAILDVNLGVTANIRGDVGTALTRYASSLTRYRAIGDVRNASRALVNIARAHVDLREWTAAAASLDEAHRLGEQLRDLRLIGSIEALRAELSHKRGDTSAAKEHCDRALAALSRIDAKDMMTEVYRRYGLVHRDASEPRLAQARFALALAYAEAMDSRLQIAETESDRAPLLVAEGRHRDALASLNRAHRLFVDAGARREIADVEERIDALDRVYVASAAECGASVDGIDAYASGHCHDVAEHAAALAAAVGVGGRELHCIRLGAYLHDIGKTALPPGVLRKQGPFSPAERLLVRRHVAAGETIVADLGFPDDVRPAVRGHHERWDGTGYPDRLAGDSIPLAARIVAVASVYNALTSGRTYRAAMSRDEALQEIEREAGSAFDPSLVAAFRSVVESVPATAGPVAPRPRNDSARSLQQQLQHRLGDTYRIQRELPGGGMSRLFLAREHMLDRDVVVKVLLPSIASALSISRFEREMQVTARLHHPLIVPVLNAGVADGLPFYIMPFIAGQSLRQRLSESTPVLPSEVVRVLLDVSDALGYAHARGVLHRDVKPGNVLLHSGHALLTDFGIARITNAAESVERCTESDVIVGTPAYMAPEQLVGDRDLDARADVYSLGVVGYEMLTGGRPSGTAAVRARLRASPDTSHADGAPSAIRSRLMDVLARALAAAREDRYPDVPSFREALLAIGPGPPAARR